MYSDWSLSRTYIYCRLVAKHQTLDLFYGRLAVKQQTIDLFYGRCVVKQQLCILTVDWSLNSEYVYVRRLVVKQKKYMYCRLVVKPQTIDLIYRRCVVKQQIYIFTVGASLNSKILNYFKVDASLSSKYTYLRSMGR